MAKRLFPAMVREWAIGRILVRAFGAMNEGMAPESTDLVGFMRTGAAIVSRSNHLTFRGLMLEHLEWREHGQAAGKQKFWRAAEHPLHPADAAAGEQLAAFSCILEATFCSTRTKSPKRMSLYIPHGCY